MTGGERREDEKKKKKNSWDVAGTVYGHWLCLERVLKPSLYFIPTQVGKLLGSSHRISNPNEQFIV